MQRIFPCGSPASNADLTLNQPPPSPPLYLVVFVTQGTLRTSIFVFLEYEMVFIQLILTGKRNHVTVWLQNE